MTQIDPDFHENGQEETPSEVHMTAPARSSSSSLASSSADVGDFTTEEHRFMRLLGNCLPTALKTALESDSFRSMLTTVVKEEVASQMATVSADLKKEVASQMATVSADLKKEISTEITKQLDERENSRRK